MKKIITAFVAIALLTVPNINAQKWEGLAQTPPMGWNSWNKFSSNIDENTIKEIADAMVSSGLADAGYVYLNIDDTWHGPRDENGFITADSKKFPKGMKELGDYIHNKGLKFGIYSDAGCKTCGGYPGSQGHEYQDARVYANWGVDFLKYDWCFTENVNPKSAYTLMRDALRQAGRPILFSMCEWGTSNPWEWAKDVSHMWRTTGDIHNGFDSEKEYGGFKTLGVLQILDKTEPLRQYSGPGHWNDPDMLEVGNGMPVNQDRAHFTMWCMLSAPLILGNDIRNMSAETKAIVLNKEVIALDQDSLGIQALRFKKENGLEFWFKPLSNGDWAMCILNRSLEPLNYTINWSDYNFTDQLTQKGTDLGVKKYNIKNLWTGKNEGNTEKSRIVTIPAQDVILYRLSK